MTAMIASIVTCIVGCNSGAPDKQALHVLECDTETGAAKIVQSVKDLQGTTYFQVDKEKKNLYSMISENGHGALVKFALDGHTLGAMTKLCDLPCEAPCHIALSPDETTLAFAAYSSGTCGTFALTRDPEGGVPYSGGEADLGPTSLSTYVFPNDAMGPRTDRQQKAFAHQAFFPEATTLGVVDLGCDRIRFFAQGEEPCRVRDPDSGSPLSVTGELKAEPGDGPRHTILSSDGKFLFVVNELSSSVTSYRQGKTERTKVGKWSALPADCPLKPTETKAAAIKLTADGKILMASNRGHDSIAFFAVNDDGSLTLKNVAKLTGRFPRDFELMPGEKFMVVGHKMSNEIQVYAFDRTACTLTPVGQPIEAWRPLCFKFL